MLARPNAPAKLPPGFRQASLPLALRFGSHITALRLLEPADAPRLLGFFASHSEETIYRRYGRASVLMNPEIAARLVGVDQTRDAALGVFETGADQPRLIAIGRYCLAADATWAEVAFVVHETRRGLGIASTLLAALVAIARERGLQRLVAHVHHDNGPMIAALRAAGATFLSSLEVSSMQATLLLSPPLVTAGSADGADSSPQNP